MTYIAGTNPCSPWTRERKDCRKTRTLAVRSTYLLVCSGDAPPVPSLALALIVPAKELAARLEVEVAVVVRQVRQDARAEDARERVPREVERLEDVEREDERRDICRGRRWWMGE